MGLEIGQPLLAPVAAQVDAVLAGLGGQLPVLVDKFGVQVQIDHLLLLGGLFDQVVIHPQVLVGEIGPLGGLGDDLLVQGDQVLDIDDGVGLDAADVVDGLAIVVVKALVVVIAQLVHPQGQIDLAILLKGQGL